MSHSERQTPRMGWLPGISASEKRVSRTDFCATEPGWKEPGGGWTAHQPPVARAQGRSGVLRASASIQSPALCSPAQAERTDVGLGCGCSVESTEPTTKPTSTTQPQPSRACPLSRTRHSNPQSETNKHTTSRLDQYITPWRKRHSSPRGTTPRKPTPRSQRPSSSQRYGNGSYFHSL
jgi:hypothetical protein